MKLSRNFRLIEVLPVVPLDLCLGVHLEVLTSWAQGWSKADLSLCTAFNFGYTGDLAMSQINLVTNNDKHPNMDLGTLGMRAARRCS